MGLRTGAIVRNFSSKTFRFYLNGEFYTVLTGLYQQTAKASIAVDSSAATENGELGGAAHWALLYYKISRLDERMRL